jgi:NTE family protein
MVCSKPKIGKDMKAPATKPYDKKVALVLQGGGALGSYQAGVFEALNETTYEPDWVAGISIGAINAAIIAGNARADRVAKLREFWNSITASPAFWNDMPQAFLHGALGDWRGSGANAALLFGQPGFFQPLNPLSWFGAQKPVSFYDTSALQSTLERLVDFDRINAKEMRFSVGAVKVRNGNFAYFDNHRIKIRAAHVMASGALPPGFPAVEIDGEHYWDGGLVSNTPLEYVLDSIPRRSRLTFQVDVFSARGPVPTNLDEVAEREKDVRFSSRTRAGTEEFRQRHTMRHLINNMIEKLPPELRDTPEAHALYEYGCVTTMDIAQLIYRPPVLQGKSKDYEFSRRIMEERWAQGRADAAATLAASPWLEPMPHQVGVRSFDVTRPKAGQS